MADPTTSKGAASTAPRLLRLVEAIVRIGGVISAVLILAALAVTLYSIFQRYIMAQPLLWADEVTGWILVATVMFGACEALRQRDHIAIDLLATRVSGVGKTLVAAWSDLAVLAFALVLGSSTWEAISFARSFGSFTSGHIEIETWIPQVPLLIGAGLLGLLSFARIVTRVTGRHVS